MVHRKDDLFSYSVTPQPGNDPQIEHESVGPGLLPRIGDEFKAGVHINSFPLIIGYVMIIKVDDLLRG